MSKIKNLSAQKTSGSVYTPEFMVKNILDLAGYKSSHILKKYVIDNSCGDGAFLTEIVKRYCQESKNNGYSNEEIKQDLEEYICGIEIVEQECEKCKANLNQAVSTFGIANVQWNIMNADALDVHIYDNKMDFVLGNPPYIRIHNLASAEKVKRFSFSQAGMTDLYITFFEIGIKMLNDTGVLGYITPSSYFNSQAGNYMRKYFVSENLMQGVVDLKHLQIFPATTYTAITILKKSKTSQAVDFFEYDEKEKIPRFVDSLLPKEFFISTNFVFSTKQNLALVKKIFYNLGHTDIVVKNGYATLCDDVYIGQFEFDSKYIIPAIKASTGKRTTIIFPYDTRAKPIGENDLKNDSNLYNYLIMHKTELLKRSMEKGESNAWYLFGRSQAISDTFKNKFTLNNLLRTKDDLKILLAPAGTGVYGGLYIISETYTFEQIKSILQTEEFATFISLLGKYKSGGFYTFSTKDVKLYLDYKFAYNGGILANE